MLGAVLWAAMAPMCAGAQGRELGQISGTAGSPQPHTGSQGSEGSQGYLGVDLADVDPQEAKALNLKVAGGAVITLIDHDAPAGQVGLRVNDVVIGLNGETVHNATGLRCRLRELPAGRTVSLEFSRDGAIQTVAVKLADRGAIEREVWKKIDGSEEMSAPAPGMGMVSGGSASPPSGGFHLPFFGASPNVGAMVEPLTAQMAQSLGVRGGPERGGRGGTEGLRRNSSGWPQHRLQDRRLGSCPARQRGKAGAACRAARQEAADRHPAGRDQAPHLTGRRPRRLAM
jgi:hypothetical protein